MAGKTFIASILAGTALVAAPAFAQTPTLEQTTAPADAPSADDIADSLNARQQLKQTATFTRTINGAVVSTETRTLEYDKNAAVRPSEWRRSPLETAADAYDAEVLTRGEALQEARIDFTLADLNRDGALTQDEFIAYVLTPTSQPETTNNAGAPRRLEATEQSQTERFMAALDAEIASEKREDEASGLFNALIARANAIETARNPDQKNKTGEETVRKLDERLFGVAYVEAFDAQDANADGVLLQNELSAFRASRNGFRALAQKIATQKPASDDS